MASVTNSNGLRMIQFVGRDGKRRPIRLGKCDARTADGVKLHVEHLIGARSLGMPLHQDTSSWLRSISEELYERLVGVGLCEPRISSLPGSMPLNQMLNEYIARRTDMKRWSIKMLKQAQGKLVGFFGEKKAIGTITVADAIDFKRQLAGKHSTAYVAKLVLLSRQFFKDAVDREILDRSPFGKLKAGSQKNAARLRFVSQEVINCAIQAAPTLEWKLIIALARYGGLRIPSELVVLRWTDINWDQRRVLIQSSKTAHHVGHESREIPLFPEIEVLLREARLAALPDSIFVIRSYRDPEKNLRKPFMDILKKAGITPWPKLFQNLRSTRQTELTELFPAHIVCSWIGNSERVAKGHYLQVTQEHFDKASGRPAVQGHNQKDQAKNEERNGNGGDGGNNVQKSGAANDAAAVCFKLQFVLSPCLMKAFHRSSS